MVPSKEALNAYVAAVAAGDMTDFTKITGGQFFTVPAGTLVLVVDEAPAPSIGTQFKVRVLEGESAGRSGWLPSKWVEGQTGGAMPAAEARAKQRAHFDKTRGNNADAAMLAKDLSGLANAANCHFSRVYAVLTASKEADNEYSRGGEIARYRQAVQSLRVEVTVDGRTWDSAGRDAQEQLTSAMVAWLHKVYPNATASVRFSDGDRFLGSGRWSRGDQQPALDLR